MNLRDTFDLEACDPGLEKADIPPEVITSTGGYAIFDSLPPIACVNAGSVAEAASLLKTHGDQAALIAGGQDLLRRLRACEKIDCGSSGNYHEVPYPLAEAIKSILKHSERP